VPHRVLPLQDGEGSAGARRIGAVRVTEVLAERSRKILFALHHGVDLEADAGGEDQALQDAGPARQGEEFPGEIILRDEEADGLRGRLLQALGETYKARWHVRPA